MNIPVDYTPEDLAFIKAQDGTMTIKEMALHLALGQKVIRNICERYGIAYLKEERPYPREKETKPRKKYTTDRMRNVIPDPEKGAIVRPLSEYSNKSAYGNQYP